MTSVYPRNNFAENPRKFPGIFHGKIRWKCRQLFREILVTRSDEILITLSKEFLVTREFHVTNSAENPKKMSTKFVEIPGNNSQDFLKSSSGISWNMLSIFLSKFTNQDLGPIIVNNYIAPPTLKKNNHLPKSECYSRFWSFWSCHVFCLFRQMNCQEKIKKMFKNF